MRFSSTWTSTAWQAFSRAGEQSVSAESVMSRLSAGLALGVPAALYSATVFPGLGGRFGIGDALQFQYLGTVLGVAHEPGYPQYVLLSFVWSHLPLPISLATKINLLSAVCALVAGALFFYVARLVSRSSVAAVLALWAVLLGFDIWSASTQAEVYALNLTWVAAVICTALLWTTTLNRKWLVALLFAYALSFGNHLTMITLLPAMVFLVLTRDPRVLLDLRMVLAGALAVVLGLAQYGLMLWRSFNPHPTVAQAVPTRRDSGRPGELHQRFLLFRHTLLARHGSGWPNRGGRVARGGSAYTGVASPWIMGRVSVVEENPELCRVPRLGGGWGVALCSGVRH